MSRDETKINVMVVDDHSIIRDSLVRIVDLVEGMTAVASCVDGNEAIEAAKLHKPDIILMDAIMPRLNGVEATKVIKDILPEVKVLILTTFSEKELIVNAFRAGCDGYVLKDITSDKLIQSIQEVAAGDFIIPTDIAKKLVQQIKEDKPQVAFSFNKTEEEIIELLRHGLTNKEIADRLHISYGTTRNYISNIYKTIGETDREKALARLAQG